MEAFPHITFAAKSDVGRKRKNNEDAFGAFPSLGVYCVADGMGGGDDGEVASAATVSAVENFVKSHPLPENSAFSADSVTAGVRSAVRGASKWIYDRAKNRNLKGCGSTFVGVCLDPARPGEATALHAGDSRLYRIRGRGIQQITKDHSAAELIGAKNESEINPMFRGMILRAVGIQPSVEVDATPLPLKEGDYILICSDGLSRMVPDKKMATIVRESATPDAAVDSLIAAANEAGGIDNVTVVLVKVGKLPPPLPVVEMPMAADGSDAPTVIGKPDDSSTFRDSDSTLSFELQTEEGDGDAASFATETTTSATLTGATDDRSANSSSESSLVGSGMKVMQESGEEPVARRQPSWKMIAIGVAVVAVVAAVLSALLGGKSGKELATDNVKVDQKAVEEAARKAAEDAARKIREESEAQVAAMQRRIDEVNRSAAEAKRRAEEEKRRVEEAKREAERAKREAEEKANREKLEAEQKEMQRRIEEQQAALKQQQEEIARKQKDLEDRAKKAQEAEEAAQKAKQEAEAAKKLAEKKAARIAAEQKAAEQKAAKEREAREAESARIAKEKESAERAAREAEEARKKADEVRKAAEEARKKAEEAQKKTEAEAKRLADEKAAEEAKRKAEEEAKRKAEEEAKLREQERKEREEELQKALSMLEEACRPETAGRFVNKVKELKLKNVSTEFCDNLCAKFKPLWKDTNNTREEKLSAAVDLTRDMKSLASELVKYAEMSRDLAVEESQPGPFKKQREIDAQAKIVENMRVFLEKAKIVRDGDPSNPKVQFVCAMMIDSVPKWF